MRFKDEEFNISDEMSKEAVANNISYWLYLKLKSGYIGNDMMCTNFLLRGKIKNYKEKKKKKNTEKDSMMAKYKLPRKYYTMNEVLLWMPVEFKMAYKMKYTVNVSFITQSFAKAPVHLTVLVHHT